MRRRLFLCLVFQVTAWGQDRAWHDAQTRDDGTFRKAGRIVTGHLPKNPEGRLDQGCGTPGRTPHYMVGQRIAFSR